jgi:hypothetical protein
VFQPCFLTYHATVFSAASHSFIDEFAQNSDSKGDLRVARPAKKSGGNMDDGVSGHAPRFAGSILLSRCRVTDRLNQDSELSSIDSDLGH